MAAGVVKSLTADQGLVTAASGGTVDTADITAAAVTYAKMQGTAAASVLLGRGSSGAGTVQEVTLGTNLSMSGTTLNAATAGGTVTSVGLVLPSDFSVTVSPITSSGNLTAVWQAVTSRVFFGGPTSGSGTPAMRALELDDLPNQSSSTLLGTSSVGGAIRAILLGTGLTMTGSTLDATGSGLSSPLTTKGDVWVYSTADARLPVGSNGQFLTADSTQATGLKWSSAGGAIWSAAPANSSSSGTAGDIAYDNIGNFYLCFAANSWRRFTGVAF